MGRFGARAAKRGCILRVIEGDRLGYPQYSGPEKRAESVRRYVRVRMETPWERFLDTERRTLEARACLTAQEGSHIISEAMTTIAR